MPGKLRRRNELGHVHFMTISCFRRLQFFRHDGVKSAFVKSMSYARERLHFRWVGYVIMPEHVHLLIFPQSDSAKVPTEISKVLHDLKGASGRWCKEALREVWRDHRTLGTKPLDEWATDEGEKPFWKPRGYDFNIIKEDKVWEKLDYIHRNPVRRGLVGHPSQWPWSSYLFYEREEDGLIRMDWNSKEILGH